MHAKNTKKKFIVETKFVFITKKIIKTDEKNKDRNCNQKTYK